MKIRHVYKTQLNIKTGQQCWGWENLKPTYKQSLLTSPRRRSAWVHGFLFEMRKWPNMTFKPTTFSTPPITTVSPLTRSFPTLQASLIYKLDTLLPSPSLLTKNPTQKKKEKPFLSLKKSQSKIPKSGSMATLHPNTALVLFVAFLLLESSSAARLLISDGDFLPAENLAVAEPALNLVLPGVDVVISDLQAVKTSPEEDSPAVSGAGGRYLPCDSETLGIRKIGFQALRLCGKHGQLLLSMLPKGGVPPSGPSHRSNDNNN